MEQMQLIMLMSGAFGTLALLIFAFSGPSADKASARRLSAAKGRHDPTAFNPMEVQMRKLAGRRNTRMDGLALRFLPKPAILRSRLEKTGKNWQLGGYLTACLIVGAVVGGLLLSRGAPLLLVLFAAIAVGLWLPHMYVGMLISRRVAAFTKSFPDAIELMVRGLRSGLPISETLGVVGSELPGPCGVEFRGVCDRIKIGRTMDAALQETADRLDTAEIQFFCITLAIQRETGGNLAETLSNLAEVLRKRSQMKLKIKAMSSESKASAYIIGALPFIVFGLIYSINPSYMGGFFTNPKLMVAGGGGLIWMSIGAFVMSQMINFEI